MKRTRRNRLRFSRQAMSLLAILFISMPTLEFGVRQAKASGLAESEPPKTEWSKTFGGTGNDWVTCVVDTSDGGYALCGITESFGFGDEDFWLVKTDANGNMEWNRTYGGTDAEEAFSLVQTSDGGYAIAGQTWSFADGFADFWLVKTDASGNVQWNRTYGGGLFDICASLIVTLDGGYALAGHTTSFGAGDSDFYLVKTDAAGNMQWNRTYGGTAYDCAYSVVQASDGGYALAGQTNSYGVGAGDFWLVKTDANGNTEWNKTYGGAGCDIANSVVYTCDGGYAMTGQSSAGSLLVKTDSSGTVQWSQTYARVPGYGDYTHSVVQTSDTGYAMVGEAYVSSAQGLDLRLLKTDANGNLQWSQTYGGAGNDYGSSVIQTRDGGYAAAGSTMSFGEGFTDFWLVKIAGDLPVHNIDTGLDYATIQDAIDASETLDGHTILVDAGTYYETPIISKSLTLVGQDREATIIDGSESVTVVLVQADYTSISNFTIQNSLRNIVVAGYINMGKPAGAIALVDCVNCTVANNTIKRCGAGVAICIGSGNNTVTGNIIHGTANFNHFAISDSAGPEASGFVGIGGNNISYNQMSGFQAGILLFNTANDLIHENRIFSNVWGIYLAAINNTITQNIIKESGQCGILLIDSSGNSIYYNDFIDNAEQVYINPEKPSINVWNDGYPSGSMNQLGGNYWSDYSGVDECWGENQDKEDSGDVIGDTPYVIDENNQDNYPLMDRWSVRGDVNRDGKVTILDITILAAAFGSFPTHPRWNHKADVNRDGIANIIDLAAAAFQYGFVRWQFE